MPSRRSPWMTQDLDDFRDLARTFCEKEIKPNSERFIKNKQVDRELWTKAGALGLLCASVTEEYGGGRGNAIKYIWRCDSKGGNEDLKKALWYLERLIAKLD